MPRLVVRYEKSKLWRKLVKLFYPDRFSIAVSKQRYRTGCVNGEGVVFVLGIFVDRVLLTRA